jgi:hypothetical protein
MLIIHKRSPAAPGITECGTNITANVAASDDWAEVTCKKCEKLDPDYQPTCKESLIVEEILPLFD